MEEEPKEQGVVIRAINLQTVGVKIVGRSPYVMNRFSEKAKQRMMKVQKEGAVARSKKVREPKDFKAEMEGATHRADEGWCGIPAPAFRNAMISACRTVGYKMTHAKLAIGIEEDGFDANDGMPLVKIHGVPKMCTLPCRNADGSCDIHPRPMWKPGWTAKVRVSYDADMFTATDVLNLLVRAGLQVGIGAGRNDSRQSAGLGWGSFKVI